MIKKIASILFFLLNVVISNANELIMRPNSIEDANANAVAMAQLINSGKVISLKGNTYYVGATDTRIYKNIVIKGPGTIITTTGNSFYVNAPVTISIRNANIQTTKAIKPGLQNRFIVNEGGNYHRKLEVIGCYINGVRIYTHVAADVDQRRVRDGVKRVFFSKNTVSNIGDYILLLTNCKSEVVRIERNEISKMYVMGFGLAVDNSYQDLGFFRMKKVFFRNNHIDNAGLIIKDSDDFGSLYMTPLLCEADYCLCEKNEFKNIIATKHQPIALYPFYLSCRDVVIKNNYMENCIHLADSRYNEMFKCKSGTDRLIEGNKYVITRECLDLIPKDNDLPRICFTGFQDDKGRVIIRNNTVDVKCNFVFGAGAMCSYDYFLFENNSLTYYDAGSSAQQLLRLKPARIKGSDIIVRNNIMRAIQPAKDVYGLFLGDCSGYDFSITNNKLVACLPTGEDDISPSSSNSFMSEGNVVDLGNNHNVVRISRDVNCNDIYSGGDNYPMYIYPSDIMKGTIKIHFPNKKPTLIMTFTRLPKSGGCYIAARSGSKTSNYVCGVDESHILIKNSDSRQVKCYPKGKEIKKVYVDNSDSGIGRLITDGKMIYYAIPSLPNESLDVEIRYRRTFDIKQEINGSVE